MWNKNLLSLGCPVGETRLHFHYEKGRKIYKGKRMGEKEIIII
jgi:hypothetical protein